MRILDIINCYVNQTQVVKSFIMKTKIKSLFFEFMLYLFKWNLFAFIELFFDIINQAGKNLMIF